MGSSSSKVAGKAAGAAGRRQYPSTSSILNSASSTANAPSTSNAPPPSSARAPAPSQVHPSPSQAPASDTKSQHVDLDGRDPHFGSALRRLGQVEHQNSAFPSTFSSQTTSASHSQPPRGKPRYGGQQNIFPPTTGATNPAIAILQARELISKRWEEESDNRGRASFAGRTLMSATDIKEALRLRDEVGSTSQEVEKQMRLKPGVLSALAAKGVVANP